MASLPKWLSAEELSRFLGAFDRGTPTGRRDYAIARCFVDLGLRTTEIARLCLEDVAWHEGTVRIRSKARRIDFLPCRSRLAARLWIICATADRTRPIAVSLSVIGRRLAGP